MRYPLASLLLPLLLATASCGSLPANAPTTPASGRSEQATTDPAQNFDKSLYAEVLERYVNDQGLVDYPSLQANPEALLQFNESMSQVSPSTFEAWSREEQMAFLINAYNALTLQSIIDQNPLKESIRDIPGVWRVRRFMVAGQSKTIDDIEHGTLRPIYQDPRIHAAINCAAISCPVLRAEPYTAAQLNAQLDDQVQRWLTSPEGIQIDRAANTVAISEIFNWFGEDWLANYQTEEGFTGDDKQRATLNFISQQLDPETADYLYQGTYTLSYLTYDWSLNGQPKYSSLD